MSMPKADDAEVPPNEHLDTGAVDDDDDHTIDRETLARLRAARAAANAASRDIDDAADHDIDDDDDDDRTIDRESLERLRAARANAEGPGPNDDGSEHDGLTIDRATMDRIRDV